jgi:hypothetical protein
MIDSKSGQLDSWIGNIKNATMNGSSQTKKPKRIDFLSECIGL